MIKVAILLSRFELSGVTTNTVDLFEGLRLREDVHPTLIVGVPENVGNNRFYDKYSEDKDVRFFKCCTNIVLNKIEKKKKEVVTKAENNYLSSECSNSTTSYGKINTIRANNLASAQRKNQVHHKKIGGR